MSNKIKKKLKVYRKLFQIRFQKSLSHQSHSSDQRNIGNDILCRISKKICLDDMYIVHARTSVRRFRTYLHNSMNRLYDIIVLHEHTV